MISDTERLDFINTAQGRTFMSYVAWGLPPDQFRAHIDTLMRQVEPIPYKYEVNILPQLSRCQKHGGTGYGVYCPVCTGEVTA